VGLLVPAPLPVSRHGCEVIAAQKEEGRFDFVPVRYVRASAAHRLIIFAFDVPFLSGEAFVMAPLEERRELLHSSASRVRRSVGRLQYAQKPPQAWALTRKI
jgi:ATP-dependent DNA ligase